MRGAELSMKARKQRRVVALVEHSIGAMRRVAHVFLPPGSSPEIYRRLIRGFHKLFIYDPITQTVKVQEGELAGAMKYGPFCDADFEFALGRYEPEVTAALRQHCRPGMTVLDIGANAGHHMLLLSRLCGASGHVHAFEPVPQNVACLLETVRLNSLRNVRVHPLAISDREGEADLKFSGVFDGFAYLTQGGHGRSECQRAPRISITVRTSDLDTICSTSRIDRIDLIKMDIEGAEMLALSGMTRILSVHRPVLILELWGTEHIAEAPILLSRFGYETHTLSVWRGFVQGAFAETSNVLALPNPNPDSVPIADDTPWEAEIIQKGRGRERNRC